MPAVFSITLAVVVVMLAAARFVSVLMRGAAFRAARPITSGNALIVAIAILALTLHCGAMFYRGVVSAIPGSEGVIALINGMGVASFILFAIPALLLLLGLRHQSPAAVVILALTLIAVGVTMYNGGSGTVHLAAIFVSVTVLAAIVSLLVSRVTRFSARRDAQLPAH